MGQAIWLQDVVVGPEEGPGQEIDAEHFQWFIEDFKAWLLARYGWICTGEFHLIEPPDEDEDEVKEREELS